MTPFTSTGAFTQDFAIRRQQRGGWHFDWNLAAVLKELIGKRTALDFGAGIGLYCLALGCRGVDGIEGIEALSDGWVMHADLTVPDLSLPDHEVALCLEVAEHIPREFETRFL